MKQRSSKKSSVQRSSVDSIPALPPIGATRVGTVSNSNRRAARWTLDPVYPWLLCASTAVAIVFFFLYLTKPVIIQQTATSAVATIQQPVSLPMSEATEPKEMMPSEHDLPSVKTVAASSDPLPSQDVMRHPLPVAPESPAFEETNLRMQHILTAGASGGQLDKIDIEVPVLYQSRNLRWTPEEIHQARELLSRLIDYQQKSRQLRLEGNRLLDSWNQLIGRSIPVTDLRADSPSLPANQVSPSSSTEHGQPDSKESIQIQHSDK